MHGPGQPPLPVQAHSQGVPATLQDVPDALRTFSTWSREVSSLFSISSLTSSWLHTQLC